MTDKIEPVALVRRAREASSRAVNHELLTGMADAIDALIAERDALQEQIGFYHMTMNTGFLDNLKAQAERAEAEAAGLRGVATEYDRCIRYMNAGGDFMAFQSMIAKEIDAARGK